LIAVEMAGMSAAKFRGICRGLIEAGALDLDVLDR